jgi:uncharacterized SAM-binding protein YcdF (DUF218 family)
MSSTTSTPIAVVLGSGLNADGSPTTVTLLRAETAARFVQDHAMKLILSGSRAPNDKGLHGNSEANAMAQVALSLGVAQEDLLLEDESYDTLTNAIFTARRYLSAMEPTVLFVVTSPFHTDRAVYIFQQVLGPQWTVVPHRAPEAPAEDRQAGAAAAMQRARDFFADIEPGALANAERKARNRKRS